MDAMDSVIIDRMGQVFSRQSRAFLDHPYPSLEERKAKLGALKRVIQRYQNRIVTAISADFGGRAAAETLMTEVLAPVLEIEHALHSLSHWMRRSRRRTDPIFETNRIWVSYQPKGVIGIITPWNFPLYLSLGPLIAALAAGNRAMIKMSELSPHTTELLAEMLAQCFDETEAAVFGGEMQAAQAFSRLPFNHIVFTGSPAVGRHVMKAAAENLTPVTLELGGKSPAIVSRSGSMTKAAESIAHGKAFNSGQVCVAPDYALVPREAVQSFATEVVSAFRSMYPSVQGNADYTSIISQPHASRISALLADAEAKGANVIACGDTGSGSRIPLHVVTNVRDDMKIATEELFGPILPVMAYDKLEDAIAYVTSHPRPLAMYPFGFQGEELERLMTQTHAGGVSIDDWCWHVLNHDLPFGGVGNSGMGTYHGVEGFRELSHAKAVFERNPDFPMKLFYPPYGTEAQMNLLKTYLGEPDPSLEPGAAPTRAEQPALT
jgi:coniferyl-aldehyde dehydrogenase